MNTNSSRKVSKYDYKKQYEMLETFIGENIIYDNIIYKLVNIYIGPILGNDNYEYVNKSHWCVCILKNNIGFLYPHINGIFKSCYPHLCWLEN